LPVPGKTFSEWIDFLYGPIFRLVGFFYRVYTANRERFRRLRENARVAGLLQALAVLILVAWIGVWYLAGDEDRQRLTDEVKQTLGIDDAPTGQ